MNPESRTPMDAIAGLDVASGLRMVGGHEAIYRRLLARFVEHHAPDAGRLRAAMHEPGTAEEAARLCHALRGVAATLGATALAEQAARLEAGLREPVGTDGGVATAQTVNPALAEAMQRLAAMLDALMADVTTALRAGAD